MLYVFVSFLTTLLWTTSKGQEEFEFPDDLESLCPYTRFCKATQGHSRKLESFTPCCRSCSCEIDCSKKQDCCTHEMETDIQDTKGATACVKAAVYLGQVEAPGVLWYQMVNTCPSGQICTTQTISAIGGLFPYYSLNDGLIYMNKVCAECNSATELLPWRVGFVCSQASTVSHITYFTSSVENLLNDRNNERDCVLHFFPPTDVDMTSKKCYPEAKIIRNCLLDVTNDPVLERYETLCKSFNATYHVSGSKYGFGNVYCALCSGETINPQCSVESKTEKAPDGSVLLLLDTLSDIGLDLIPLRNEICTQVRNQRCIKNFFAINYIFMYFLLAHVNNKSRYNCM